MEAGFSNLNWLAIIVSAVAAFALGGLWYSPLLFGNTWAKEIGLSEKTQKKANMVRIFGVSYLLMLIAAVNLAMFIGPKANLAFGAMAGFLAGIGWVATNLGVLYLFEQRTLKLFLINAGYGVVNLTIMGAILGAWK